MNDQNSSKISKATHDLFEILELNKKFIRSLTEYESAKDTHLSIESIEKVYSLTVHTFCSTAKAEARPVLLGDKTFAIEYVFLAEKKGESIEVFRFYLKQNGILREGVSDADTKLGEYDNKYNARNLSTKVAEGMLDSKFFAPTATR